MVLLTKWIKLLIFMYEHYNLLNTSGWIDYDKQKIYSSRAFFHNVMNECVKLDWIKMRKSNVGAAITKEYSLTIDGYFIVHTVFKDIEKNAD